MTVTSDPMVALLYGAMAHESLAAGVVAAGDLVAGQPGPWLLTDLARADLAADVVARLTVAHPQADSPVSAVPGSDVLAALGEARSRIQGFWAAHRDTLPGHLCHRLEQLEDRIGGFCDDYPTGIVWPLAAAAGSIGDAGDDVPAGDGSAASPAGPRSTALGDPAPRVPWPTGDLAQHYRVDEWHLLIRELGLSVPDVVARFRAACVDAGKPRPSSLRAVHGAPRLAQVLLDVLAAMATSGAGS